METQKKILILGVTASGKGRLGFELSKRLDGEIVSVDSMKVYRRMDIGTAKPPLEKREQVRYHCIDVVEPSEAFSVGQFLEHAEAAIADINARGKRVVAVGGTALYIKALLYGLFEGPRADAQVRENLKAEAARVGLGALHERLAKVDAEAATRIHANDEKRIIRALEVYELTGRGISSFQNQWDEDELKSGWEVIGLRREKEQESKRINARVKRMMDEGLVEEVRQLTGEERQLSAQARAAIGYAEILDYFEGKWRLDEAVEKIKINTRRLAKHQRTWFKRFAGVRWIDVEEGDDVESVIQKLKNIK